MPNQKQRKKKDGANKNKKLQAMRTKEALARPGDRPTATGKWPGQESKFEMLQDRPGNMRRA
jgi:NADH:ubiquinone oxidoreductase subunit